MPRQIQLMMITAVPEIASYVEEFGVGRIFLDAEVIGKNKRQKNLDLPSHTHSFEDVSQVKKVLSCAEVMLRINPFGDQTRDEVEKAIDSGVDCIMLPYFHHQDEVKAFLDIVDGRVKTNLLLETASAAGRANQILALPGIDEIHFGLNDLKISLKHNFLFECFAGGLIEFLCQVAQKNNLSYGIGGVGRVGKELLPADLIIKEHVRLNSQRVILSRVFHGNAKNLAQLHLHVNFSQAIEELRKIEKEAHQRSPDQKIKDQLTFCEKVDHVAQMLKSK